MFTIKKDYISNEKTVTVIPSLYVKLFEYLTRINNIPFEQNDALIKDKSNIPKKMPLFSTTPDNRDDKRITKRLTVISSKIKPDAYQKIFWEYIASDEDEPKPNQPITPEMVSKMVYNGTFWGQLSERNNDND